MAAILHPEPLSTPRPARPRLVLLDGGRATPAPERARREVRESARRSITRVRVAPVLLAAAALFGAWALATTPGASVVHAPEAGVHVVSSGESLWSIAGGLGVRGDRREIVDRLADVNGGYTVHIDQRLIIPADLLGGK